MLNSERGSRECRRGFTLIELLVVIAIIALLVSLLLPAIGRAKKVAMMARSLSNLRQINIGGRTYQEDFKGKMPITLSYQRGVGPPSPVPPDPQWGNLEGWCTWSYGGKNNSGRWTQTEGTAFDVEAADRPMNPYMYPELTFDAPPRPTQMPATDPNRDVLLLDVYRDPADILSHQGSQWPNETTLGISSYEHVGTSYHCNFKWWNQLSGDFPRRMRNGAARMAVADTFQSSRFCWMHDESADIVTESTNPNFRYRNYYGDINRSVMGFLDGHAKYVNVIPGAIPASFSNNDYTFIFQDLRENP